MSEDIFDLDVQEIELDDDHDVQTGVTASACCK